MCGSAKRIGGMVLACVISTVLVSCLSPCYGDPVAQTITLTQGVNGYYGGADTYLYQSTDSNFGDSNYLYVRYDSGHDYDHDTLIKFDLTGQLPSGACIKSATLRLYQYAGYNMYPPDWLKVGAYRLLKDWTEGTGGTTGASWPFRHASHTDLWMVGGARGVDSDTNADHHHTHHVSHPYAGIADSVATITDGARWVEWDVTPSVQYWLSNPSGNYGMVLDWWHEGVFAYDGNSGADIRSNHYSDTSLRPQLVITYVVPTAEPDINLQLSHLTLNYWNTDPGITFSTYTGGLLVCSGTTSDSIWGMDGCETNYTINSSFEAQIRVKLQHGIVGVNQGEFGFGIYQPGTSNYIRLLAVGFSAQYYEVSGTCPSSGNGEGHDGSAYWASYWDGVYPTYPPASPAARFFAQTPEDEANTYLTWKMRYDKTNGMFYVFVNDTMVTYYSKVNFTNWVAAIVHDNDRIGVWTYVVTDFIDTIPPSPNPMTWASEPAALDTGRIAMTATTATDDHPPVYYYITETTGNPGGTSSGWATRIAYTDTGLNANTQYGYKVKAKDSVIPANVGSDSTIGYAYTLIPAPTGCTASNPTATTIDLAATGSLPNITQGLSGTQFATTGGEWTGLWRVNLITDTAMGLTPNTSYTFHAKARNGDAIPTGWSAGTATIRTLANVPGAMAYGPISCQAIQANWGSNGNPAGTEYCCVEVTTGQSSGWTTGTSWLLTGLQPGQQYEFKVRARNADLVETDNVNLGFVQTQLSIGQAKKQFRPGDLVALDNKVVTAVFKQQGLAFIEDNFAFGQQEGVAGIGVRLSDTVLEVREGDVVGVSGQLVTNDPPYDQELIISGRLSLPTPLIGRLTPYGTIGRSLGGGPFGSQPGVLDDVTLLPPTPARGLSNIGMLVKGWGLANDGGLGGNDYFWIDDGTGLRDGASKGVRVSLEPIGGIINPLPGYCSVTGIMRCMVVNTTVGKPLNVRVIWPRRLTDIVDYPVLGPPSD